MQLEAGYLEALLYFVKMDPKFVGSPMHFKRYQRSLLNTTLLAKGLFDFFIPDLKPPNQYCHIEELESLFQIGKL